MKRTSAIKAVLIVICMLAAGICYAGTKNEKAVSLLSLEMPETEMTSTEHTGEPMTESPGHVQEESSSEAVCYVYICGEVNFPGVYPMAEGSRVYQVVDQAGGFTDAAAAEYLNMADAVHDGLKLVVPAASELPDEKRYGDTSQEQAGQREGSAVKTKVNLNTAGKEALMTLTGIGEARAEDIIRYRTEQGPFQRIEDVMKISGIKDAAFQKIKNDITV